MTSFRTTRLVVPAFCALMTASSAIAQTATTPAAAPARSPGIDLALQAAQAAVATCTANGYNVAVTILDAAGNTRLVYTSDKANPIMADYSGKKAYTALMFKESSGDAGLQQASDPAVDARIKADPKFFAKPGGFLLKAGADIVGAIGVGGAPKGDKDEMCAQAGIAKIQGMLK